MKTLGKRVALLAVVCAAAGVVGCDGTKSDSRDDLLNPIDNSGTVVIVNDSDNNDINVGDQAAAQ